VDGAGSLWPDFVDFCAVFFLLANFWQNFDLKNVISTNNTKDFSWEKWSKFAKFRKEKKSTWPDFYNKFQ
jgi:hypothetical protein